MANMKSESGKYAVLAKLAQCGGDYVSGETLGKEIGISRAAVWKHIAELRHEGYEIAASTRKGYRLKQDTDLINVPVLRNALADSMFGSNIIFFDVLDSTNTKAYSMALEGSPEGTVLIADSQTSGRGRMGRQWQSVSGKGIWMSVILRPNLPLNRAQLITLAASLAVAQAIEKLTGVKVGIKWPNDVIADGRKVCGILTEMNTEIDKVNHIIVGVGINFSQQDCDFTEDLSERAVSLLEYLKSRGIRVEKLTRNDIIKEVLLSLEECFESLLVGRSSRVLDGWAEYSVTIGKRIFVSDRERKYYGKAIGINQDGSLLIETDDGETKSVTSGEVSIRGIMGYA